MRKMRTVLVLVVLLALLGTQAAWAAPPASSIVHVVQRGETLYSIARHYGSSVSAIAAANGITNVNRITVGQRLVIPTGSPGTTPPGSVYVVRPGDTLYSIARRLGVTVQALVNVNHIANPNRIYAGQRLIVPSDGGHTPAPGTYYRVQRGDTLYSIAWRYGVTVWAIVHANGLANPNLIYAGQVLFIP